MALSTQQKQDIIFLLGYPGKTLIQASTHYNSVTASRLDNLIPEIEAQANKLVARVQNIDCILDAALSRMSTLKLQDIELDANESHRLRRERRVLLGELADVLDLDVVKSGGVNINVIS